MALLACKQYLNGYDKRRSIPLIKELSGSDSECLTSWLCILTKREAMPSIRPFFARFVEVFQTFVLMKLIRGQ